MKMMKQQQTLRRLIACVMILFMFLGSAEAKQESVSRQSTFEIASELAVALHLKPLKRSWKEDKQERKDLAASVGMSHRSYKGTRRQNEKFNELALKKLKEIAVENNQNKIIAAVAVPTDAQAELPSSDSIELDKEALDDAWQVLLAQVEQPLPAEEVIAPVPTPTPATVAAPSPAATPVAKTEKNISAVDATASALAAETPRTTENISKQNNPKKDMLIVFLLLVLALGLILFQRASQKKNTPPLTEEEEIDRALEASRVEVPESDPEILLGEPTGELVVLSDQPVIRPEPLPEHLVKSLKKQRTQMIKDLEGTVVPLKRIVEIGCETFTELERAVHNCEEIETDTGEGKECFVSVLQQAKDPLRQLKIVMRSYVPQADDFLELSKLVEKAPPLFTPLFMSIMAAEAATVVREEKPENLPILHEIAVRDLNLSRTRIDRLIPLPQEVEV